MSDDLEARLLAEAGGAQHTLGRLLREAASTITRLQGERERAVNSILRRADEDPDEFAAWTALHSANTDLTLRAEHAEAELTRLRAEIETVLAGGREDRETIDALEGRVGVLSEALGPFARHGALFSGDEHDHINVPHIVRDFRCAHTALTETKPVEHAKALGAAIDNTLAERNTTYGDFTFDAQLADNLIRVMEAHASWHSTLNGVQRHALRVIALKMARIINGDPNYRDSWHDIQGYAKLAEDRCGGAGLQRDMAAMAQLQRETLAAKNG